MFRQISFLSPLADFVFWVTLGLWLLWVMPCDFHSYWTSWRIISLKGVRLERSLRSLLFGTMKASSILGVADSSKTWTKHSNIFAHIGTFKVVIWISSYKIKKNINFNKFKYTSTIFYSPPFDETLYSTDYDKSRKKLLLLWSLQFHRFSGSHLLLSNLAYGGATCFLGKLDYHPRNFQFIQFASHHMI